MDLIRELFSNNVCRSFAEDDFVDKLAEYHLTDVQINSLRQLFNDGQYEAFRRGMGVALRLILEAGLV